MKKEPEKKKCPRPKQSIGERNIELILRKYCIRYQKEYTFKNLVSSKGFPLRYDFAILNENFQVIRLIEFDGPQHKTATPHFGGEKALQKTREHDWLKNRYAKGHRIPLVRIPYSERDNITLSILFGDKYLIK